MDRHFLEFWGNFLLALAKGQKQMEDLAKWMRRGLLNLGDFTALFRRAYGLEDLDQNSPDYLKMWQQAEESFRHSYKEYLSLLGVVPREEYAELARKYEALQEKAAAQEEVIKQLRTLLEEKGMGFDLMTLEFQKLVQKQGSEFQKLMKAFQEASREP